jgi:hypothetical protein
MARGPDRDPSGRKNNPNYLWSPERRAEFSKILKTHWDDPRWRRKYLPAHRARTKNVMKRFWANPVHRERASVAATAHLPKRAKTRYRYVDRKGRVFNFRSGSRYELGVAKILDERRLTWTYETHILRLSDGHRYIPDFWVKEWKTFVEVKGWPLCGIDKVKLARKDGHSVLLIRHLSELPK